MHTISSLVAVTTLIGSTALATTVLDTVSIGYIGNIPDATTGFGRVGYRYEIGKYEVTNAQYAAFLNAVAATDTHGLYNTSMASGYGGITRSGTGGSYTYSAVSGRENAAVVYTDFYDACRFTNWLHNGQLAGGAGAASTETGSYTMSTGAFVTRNAGATWVIPSENEWYKAAYYQQVTQGGDADSYWLYGTGTNVMQTSWANYSGSGVGRTRNVGSYAANFHGLFDMAGNASEFTDTIDGTGRIMRGGSFAFGASTLEATNRSTANPTNEYLAWGFRVALVPGPSGAALLALSALGARRRKN
ncbi:MAG: formylglycine-generating enzyme family protein [Planctomycetaceae bacterium]|nr:formylglycine-generating enzyme family protein [Planctomycetaceae bacterium]